MLSLMFSGQNIPIGIKLILLFLSSVIMKLNDFETMVVLLYFFLVAGGRHTHAGHKIQVQKNLIMGQELTIFYALDHACTKSRTRKTTASSLAT